MEWTTSGLQPASAGDRLHLLRGHWSRSWSLGPGTNLHSCYSTTSAPDSWLVLKGFWTCTLMGFRFKKESFVFKMRNKNQMCFFCSLLTWHGDVLKIIASGFSSKTLPQIGRKLKIQYDPLEKNPNCTHKSHLNSGILTWQWKNPAGAKCCRCTQYPNGLIGISMASWDWFLKRVEAGIPLPLQKVLYWLRFSQWLTVRINSIIISWIHNFFQQTMIQRSRWNK